MNRLVVATTILILLFLLTPVSAMAQSFHWEVAARHGNPAYGLQAVCFIDSLHGWTAGGSDSIYHTTTGGDSWGYSPGTPMVIHGISMRDSLVGWCAGDNRAVGRILETTDGGKSWQLKYESLYQGNNAEFLTGVAVVGSNSIVASGYARTSASSADTAIVAIVVRSSDQGNTWKRTLLDRISKATHVQFVDSLHGFCDATDSILYRTSDGGTNWEKLIYPISYVNTYFLSHQLGWGAEVGRFYRTTDGGYSWNLTYQQPFPQEQSLNVQRVCFTDSLYGWSFGYIFYQGILSEGIFHTTNSGFNWQKESEGLTDDGGTLLDAVIVDRAHGWAVSFDGRILSYSRVSDAVPEPERESQKPQIFVMDQNYPNPFNTLCRIVLMSR